MIKDRLLSLPAPKAGNKARMSSFVTPQPSSGGPSQCNTKASKKYKACRLRRKKNFGASQPCSDPSTFEEHRMLPWWLQITTAVTLMGAMCSLVYVYPGGRGHKQADIWKSLSFQKPLLWTRPAAMMWMKWATRPAGGTEAGGPRTWKGRVKAGGSRRQTESAPGGKGGVWGVRGREGGTGAIYAREPRVLRPASPVLTFLPGTCLHQPASKGRKAALES